MRFNPGEHLAEQLAERGMSAAELGRPAITGETALRLGHFLGNSPQFWLNLQALYDLRTAEKKVGGAIRSLPTLSAAQ